MSSFYVRRSLLGNSTLPHCMSAELRREDIVHSPEASECSLDDGWAKYSRMPRSFSPPPPLALPTPASCPNAWAVGPQGYNIEGPTGSERSPLLGQTSALGSPTKHTFSEYMSVAGTSSSRPPISKHSAHNRLSMNQKSKSDSKSKSEREKEFVKTAGSDAVLPLEKPREESEEKHLSPTLSSGPSLTVPHDSRGITNCQPGPERDSNSISKRPVDISRWASALQDMAISSCAPRHIPSSPLSPNSKLLKVKLTNMLFDLSSQVSPPRPHYIS